MERVNKVFVQEKVAALIISMASLWQLLKSINISQWDIEQKRDSVVKSNVK